MGTMAHTTEAIEVFILGKPAENRLHRIADRLLPWTPRLVPAILGGNLLPSTAYPHRSVIFPRKSNTGKDLTPEEVAHIHTLIPQLAQELPPERQPIANNIVPTDRIRVRRLKHPSFFDKLTINLTPDGKHSRQNKSNDFFAKRTIALNAMQQHQFTPQKDQIVEDIATETMQELQHNNIPEIHNQVQNTLATRESQVTQALQPTWLEQKIASLAQNVLVGFDVQRHLGAIDMNQLARNIVYEGEIVRTTTGKNPNIAFGGWLLGGLGVLATWIENKKQWEWPDTLIDKFAHWYTKYKYPNPRIFGEKLQHSNITQTVALANVTPGLNSPLVLWALQMNGREQLRQLLQQGNEDTRRRIVRVAREGLLHEYSQFNKDRRASRRESIMERLPFGH